MDTLLVLPTARVTQMSIFNAFQILAYAIQQCTGAQINVVST